MEISEKKKEKERKNRNEKRRKKRSKPGHFLQSNVGGLAYAE